MGVARRRPSHVHDLTKLYAEVKNKLDLPNGIVQRLGELSSYYTIARYPNAGLTRPSIGITRIQAEEALALTERVIGCVEDGLKRAAKS